MEFIFLLLSNTAFVILENIFPNIYHYLVIVLLMLIPIVLIIEKWIHKDR